MKKIKVGFLQLFFMLIMTSCGSSYSSMKDGDVLRAAIDAPEHFKAATAFDGSCVSPLIDPRDGTEITFIRSTAGMADYQVPAGKYGVKKGELLRANCQNGEVIGIVKK